MSKLQRLVLVVAILASTVAFLDGSVVNVALPAIERELGGGLMIQQWVVDAYLITLGALIMVAGSLSDLFGRIKILTIGLVGFALTSLLCALAPDAVFLILARGLQGIAGALLVPSSLALIISSFKHQELGKAIGQWTAWTGVAFVIGPLLGGLLVDSWSWRLIFVINLLPVILTLWLIRLIRLPRVSANSDLTSRARVDVVGSALCALGLGAAVFGLVEQPHYGWGDPRIWLTMTGGLLAVVGFVIYEAVATEPMLSFGLFKVRNFSFGNLATAAIYGALGVATFVIAIFVQQVGGYSALEAGLSLLPVTIVMFVLSPRVGMLSAKFGPRLFMTVGPLTAAAGFLLMLGITVPINYTTQLMPGIMLYAVGLATTVSPLTAAVLGSIDKSHAGMASAVNNAVARIAGLVATALIGVVAGQHLDKTGFRRSLVLIAALMVLGGVISFVGIKNNKTSSLSL